MKRRLYLFLTITSFVSSFLFCSCGGGGEDANPSDSGKPVKGTIGVSVLTLGNPFFSVIADNVKIEAATQTFATITAPELRAFCTK